MIKVGLALYKWATWRKVSLLTISSLLSHLFVPWLIMATTISQTKRQSGQQIAPTPPINNALA